MPICEKCGSQMEIRQEGSTQGLFCTNCDWSIVTTYIPETQRDETLYEVSIINGDAQNKQHIRTVAQVANVNFLAARKLLQERSPFVVFRGNAKEVVRVREVLSMPELVYEITPEFPWQGDQILELEGYY
ncbi:hypothetical protein Cylst_4545 [Cylindrospermum stagnale PCC 7417]|uniref:Uncharacterized protein n=2 Tax=Cylindrospermum stagnale TaxID=142864 RepID=K9X2G0_9NOST|nr:hypothetical protein Cylst_4545 [Cylindrospermum stagnale PCC 7417]